LQKSHKFRFPMLNGASAYPSDAPAYRWDGGGVRGIGARKPNEREQTYFSMR
jgi:hypothetical protein